MLVGGLAEKPEATRVCITRSVTIAPAVRECILREVGFGADDDDQSILFADLSARASKKARRGRVLS